jgi:ribosomal protein S17
MSALKKYVKKLQSITALLETLKRKDLLALVVSIKNNKILTKTGVGLVQIRYLERVTKKIMQKSKRLMYHDEFSRSRTGQFIKIINHSPRSKYKSWYITDIVE